MAKKQTLEEIVKVEFRDCRFHADCMALMVKKYRNYDKWINVALAITSSSSIASWAIWSQYAMFWGILIAATSTFYMSGLTNTVCAMSVHNYWKYERT